VGVRTVTAPDLPRAHLEDKEKEEKEEMSRVAAIFDLDHTLLSESSGTLIVRYMRREGELWRYFRRRDVIRMIGSLARYQMGRLDSIEMLRRAARLTAGIPVDEFWQLIANWFEEMVIYTISRGALEQLAWHRNQDHIPVICSAASQFSVLPVAHHLCIEHALHTEWLVADGRLTGELGIPILYGQGKVLKTREWAAEQDVNLADSYFYTDHHSDLPLLEAVAHPVAVNPNQKLLRTATARGWPVVDWHQDAA